MNVLWIKFTDKNFEACFTYLRYYRRLEHRQTQKKEHVKKIETIPNYKPKSKASEEANHS